MIADKDFWCKAAAPAADPCERDEQMPSQTNQESSREASRESDREGACQVTIAYPNGSVGRTSWITPEAVEKLRKAFQRKPSGGPRIVCIFRRKVKKP
jgi:hypothetical protein